MEFAHGYSFGRNGAWTRVRGIWGPGPRQNDKELGQAACYRVADLDDTEALP